MLFTKIMINCYTALLVYIYYYKVTKTTHCLLERKIDAGLSAINLEVLGHSHNPTFIVNLYAQIIYHSWMPNGF